MYDAIGHTYKGHMKHKVIKLEVPQTDECRKTFGYNALTHFKEQHTLRNKKVDMIRIEEGDVFQIESLKV